MPQSRYCCTLIVRTWIRADTLERLPDFSMGSLQMSCVGTGALLGSTANSCGEGQGTCEVALA